jgi:hypothetical protein
VDINHGSSLDENPSLEAQRLLDEQKSLDK